MSRYIFDGFNYDVRRDGEAVDILITLRVDEVDGTLCRELRYEVGRVTYWVINGVLEEDGRKFCSHISDYEGDLSLEASNIWSDIDEVNQPEDSESEYSYDERVISSDVVISADVIKTIVDTDSSYED